MVDVGSHDPTKDDDEVEEHGAWGVALVVLHSVCVNDVAGFMVGLMVGRLISSGGHVSAITLPPGAMWRSAARLGVYGRVLQRRSARQAHILILIPPFLYHQFTILVHRTCANIIFS